MIDWTEDIVKDLARRKTVLFIGSGVSANSVSVDGTHPPIWKNFLNETLKYIPGGESHNYIDELLNKGDMLLACEIIIEHIGEHKFEEIAQDLFRRPGFKPAEIHEVIYNLDSRIVISPNVDKIYDQYALNTSFGTVVIKKYSDEDIVRFIREQDRIILKAHGSIDTPSSMIFSQYQYNQARYKYSNFYKIMDALALTHTFIFIGCGLNDPDIRLTMENYNFSYFQTKSHFFITSKEEIKLDQVKSLEKNRNFKVLTYSNSDGSHKNLLESLKNLLNLVEEERESLVVNQIGKFTYRRAF